MLMKYLFKKPAAVIGFAALIIISPQVAVRLTIRLAGLIEAAGAGSPELWTILFRTLLLFASGSVLAWLENILINLLIAKARTSLKEDMFGNLAYASCENFGNDHVGTYIAEFTNDMTIVEHRFFYAVLSLVSAVITYVTCFAAILSLDLYFAGIVCFFELLGFLICFLFSSRTRKVNSAYITQLSDFTQRLREIFSGRAAILNYGAEQAITDLFRSDSSQTEDRKMNSELTISFVGSFAHFIRCMAAYSVIAFGAVWITNGRLDFSEVFVAYSFANTLSAPVKKILSGLNEIHASASVVQRIQSGIAYRRQESALCGEDVPFDGIELKGITVDRGGRRILSDIDLRLEPGKKYLVVGENGSGKSTLLRLLVRGNDSYRGSILIGGAELRALGYDTVSRHISYTNEDVPLLTDTVFNNVALYRDVSGEQVRNAMLSAGLQIPADRVIRDGGKNISSGERRRIGLARCLLANPDVLLLDEYHSTLDVVSAHEIEKQILQLEKTVVTVSHNFSIRLIERYDCIIMIDKGRITARGTHSELMAGCEQYRSLMRIRTGV